MTRAWPAAWLCGVHLVELMDSSLPQALEGMAHLALEEANGALEGIAQVFGGLAYHQACVRLRRPSSETLVESIAR